MVVLVHVGVDVGGTYTDAVVMRQVNKQETVVSSAKHPTTWDVTAGVCKAIGTALDRAVDFMPAGEDVCVQRVHIGTTHFMNAVVQRRDLSKVAVLRFCGPVSVKLPPFIDFPADLKKAICGTVDMLDGGYEFNGQGVIRPVSEEQVLKVIDQLKKKGLSNVVVTGIFSPVNNKQEMQVEDIFKSHYPEASVTLSHQVGQIGVLERENASILNESLKPLCRRTVTAFRTALDQLGLTCPFFLTQNDGTLISSEQALILPVLTIASGPTNSMRGAAFLAGKESTDVMAVVDVGGTTTDVGILVRGFPREAQMKVKVGGVRTNFRMPDVLSIGLGGGSLVVSHNKDGKEHVSVGPQSTGYRLATEGLVFGGSTLTASDVAVAAKVAHMGEPRLVNHLSPELVTAAMQTMRMKVEECIDQVKTSREAIPVILVGGGSALIQSDVPLKGTSLVLKPQHYEVANAVGAALSQVSGSEDVLRDLSSVSREDAMEAAQQKARERAVHAGADPSTVKITEVQEIQASYLPGNATTIKVKAVGDLLWTASDLQAARWSKGSHTRIGWNDEEGYAGVQQVSSSAGQSLVEMEKEEDTSVEDTPPHIDPSTGEWVLSEWDMVCLSVGTNILGCGGGGNSYFVKLRALQAVRQGKRITVVKPEDMAARMDSDDVAVFIAVMGAPTVLGEKLLNGTEYRATLKSMQDLFTIGHYSDGQLHNTAGVDIKQGNGVTYIDDYQPGKQPEGFKYAPKKKVVALLGVEIGGLNGMEPLLAAAETGLPVIDCDLMGRAFPELQQTCFLIYGHDPHPSFLTDMNDVGIRPVILHADTAKDMENHFRKVCVDLGCCCPFMVDMLGPEDIMNRSVLYSVSRAWYVGRQVLRARRMKESPVDAIIEATGGRLVATGKICDLKRQTTGGFARGQMVVEGFEGIDVALPIVIKFQNENLICQQKTPTGDFQLLACTPDLITVVELESGEPVPVEELRYGLRVAILVMPVDPRMATPRALDVVGPQAFGYTKEEATYATSVGRYTVTSYPWTVADEGRKGV